MAGKGGAAAPYATEEELELLSQDERDALEGVTRGGRLPPEADAPAETNEEAAGATGPADDDGGAGEPDDAEGATGAEGEDEPDGATAAEGATGAEGSTGDRAALEELVSEEGPREAPLFAPKLSVDDKRDFAAELTDAKQKFDDGDLSLGEYLDKRDEINNAKSRAEFNRESGEQIWKAEQDMFFGAKEHQHYQNNPVLFAALGAAVPQVVADPKNAGLSRMRILYKAHELVQQQLGGGAVVTAPAGPAGKPPGRAARETVTTLGGLPAAGTEQPNRAEFDHLDRMEGEDLEEAIARLTPDQLARYQQGK
jgi:hypothetical protein